jgi:putative colanic acid biosynthesis UDP-glucose lipid carrier transferase
MRTRNLIALFFLTDIAVLNALVIWVAHLHYGPAETNTPSIGHLVVIFSCSWLITTLIFIDDTRNLKLGLSKVFKTQLKKFVVFVSLVSVVIICFKLDDFSRSVFFGAISLFLIFRTIILLWFFYYYSLRDQLNDRPCLIVGNTKIGRELFRYYTKYSFIGLKPMGMLDNDTTGKPINNVLGTIDDFDRIYETQPFYDVIIALPLSEMESIKDVISRCEKNGIKSHVVPNYYGSVDRVFKINMLGSFPMLDLRAIPLDGYPNRFWKRVLDLSVALALLTFLAPLMLLITLLIKLESKGPVLYKPVRLGADNKPFILLKFRSMSVCDDAASGTLSTSENDGRLTRFGKFLRKTNLDELPQLFNVVMNEMSLVGPRPHRIHLNMALKQKMNNYMVRHLVKPGITGWAQVNGWRGPTESRLQYMGRTLHDVWYIEHWNFWLDVYILFLTLCGKKVKRNAF